MINARSNSCQTDGETNRQKMYFLNCFYNILFILNVFTCILNIERNKMFVLLIIYTYCFCYLCHRRYFSRIYYLLVLLLIFSVYCCCK